MYGFKQLMSRKWRRTVASLRIVAFERCSSRDPLRHVVLVTSADVLYNSFETRCFRRVQDSCYDSKPPWPRPTTTVHHTLLEKARASLVDWGFRSLFVVFDVASFSIGEGLFGCVL